MHCMSFMNALQCGPSGTHKAEIAKGLDIANKFSNSSVLRSSAKQELHLAPWFCKTQLA